MAESLQVASGIGDHKYTVVYEHFPKENIVVATVPALQGCVTAGNTIDEARENIKEALSLIIEDMIACGESLPEEPSRIETELLNFTFAS